MSITWRDGITTLATAAMIVLVRAYFHNWTWVIASSLNWTIVVVLMLIIAGFVFSYAQDVTRSGLWSLTAWFIVLTSIGLAGVGLITGSSNYLALLMLNSLLLWSAAMIRHLTVPSTTLTSIHA